MKGFTSLRLRLILLPILVVIAGSVVLAVLEIGAARDRIRVETRASMQVGRTLIENALARRHTYREQDALLGLADELPNVRHIRFAVGKIGVEPPDFTAQDHDVPGHDVPGWFEALVKPMPMTQRFRVAAAGYKTAGEVVMVANPDDELREIWDDWSELTSVLVAISISVAVVVAVVVTHGMRPLGALAEGLDRLGEGDLSVSLTPVEDIELRRLGARFNRLVESLRRVTEDNRLLIGRLMSLQEAERKEIAHELHDEFGPSLFGIRAELSSIGAMARSEPPKIGEIEERLKSIGALVEQIQRTNTGLLERLRPLVLQEIGLTAALTRLVDAWAERYPEIRWKRRIGRCNDLPEPVALALYRAVQECLTNVVRHAGANAVEVTLSRSAQGVRVSVKDDGKGFAEETRFGFGLLGMAERARALGGRLEVSKPKGGGALIELIHPVEEPA
jgi:two-component system, NarL family, sensor histidine kinase UhpB